MFKTTSYSSLSQLFAHLPDDASIISSLDDSDYSDDEIYPEDSASQVDWEEEQGLPIAIPGPKMTKSSMNDTLDNVFQFPISSPGKRRWNTLDQDGCRKKFASLDSTIVCTPDMDCETFFGSPVIPISLPTTPPGDATPAKGRSHRMTSQTTLFESPHSPQIDGMIESTIERLRMENHLLRQRILEYAQMLSRK